MYNKSAVDEITATLAREVRRQLGDKLDMIVLLHGSCALGDSDEEPDFDIVIIADVAMEDCWQISEDAGDAISALIIEHSIHIVTTVINSELFYKHNSSYLYYQNIMQYGVLLDT